MTKISDAGEREREEHEGVQFLFRRDEMDMDVDLLSLSQLKDRHPGSKEQIDLLLSHMKRYKRNWGRAFSYLSGEWHRQQQAGWKERR
ncbi:MAG TPA: hypothetical protein PKD55_10745 [Bellilinea sp.]|nr:hypothetical protein [Bellilinea sp.]